MIISPVPSARDAVDVPSFDIDLFDDDVLRHPYGPVVFLSRHNTYAFPGYAEVQVTAFEDEAPVMDEVVDGHLVVSDIHGSVWKVLVEEGQVVEAGASIVILEAMKTELTIFAPISGTVRSIYCRPGRAVATGDRLLVIEDL